LLNRIDFKKLRVFLEYAVYLLLAMLLQGLLFSRLSIFGVKGFVLPAAVVAAGMYLGGMRGAVFGICLGLVTDMSYTESSFMYTIVFALIGFGAGFASEFYINKSFLVFMVMSVIAVLLSGLAQYLAAVIFGGAELVQGIVTVLLQTALSIPPMALLYLPFRNHKD
jgi:cell shape-determining protein MreD